MGAAVFHAAPAAGIIPGVQCLASQSFIPGRQYYVLLSNIISLRQYYALIRSNIYFESMYQVYIILLGSKRGSSLELEALVWRQYYRGKYHGRQKRLYSVAYFVGSILQAFVRAVVCRQYSAGSILRASVLYH